MNPNPLDRPEPKRGRQRSGISYTQVNILFSSEQQEFPSADKFKAFPPEAQKAILIGLDREQLARHTWLNTQQSYDHQLNLQNCRYHFVWRMTGTICGFLLALGIFSGGAWLVKNGASLAGATAMIVAISGLIGTAIYGHRVAIQSKEDETLAAATSETQQPSN